MPPRTNPDCPSQTHQSVKAIRVKPSCICPGAHHDAYEVVKQTENARRAEARATYGITEPTDSVLAPDFYSPDIPEPTYEAGQLEMELHERDDLPCRDEDPELFFPLGGRWGHEGKFQEAVAKAVCRRCPAVDDCLTYALRTGDTWAVLGGTSASERREMRAAMRGVAA